MGRCQARQPMFGTQSLMALSAPDYQGRQQPLWLPQRFAMARVFARVLSGWASLVSNRPGLVRCFGHHVSISLHPFTPPALPGFFATMGALTPGRPALRFPKAHEHRLWRRPGIPAFCRDCSIILGVFSSQNGPDAGPSWSGARSVPADPAACPGRYAGECVQPSALSRCSFVPCDSAGYFVPPHCWSPAGICHPGTSAPSPSSGWKACPEPGPAACTRLTRPVAEPVEPAPSPSGSGGRTIGRPPP